MGESCFIKQLLDIGCQALLVPMVETRSKRGTWCAVRYAPYGIRDITVESLQSGDFGL